MHDRGIPTPKPFRFPDAKAANRAHCRLSSAPRTTIRKHPRQVRSNHANGPASAPNASTSTTAMRTIAACIAPHCSRPHDRQRSGYGLLWRMSPDRSGPGMNACRYAVRDVRAFSCSQDPTRWLMALSGFAASRRRKCLMLCWRKLRFWDGGRHFGGKCVGFATEVAPT